MAKTKAQLEAENELLQEQIAELRAEIEINIDADGYDGYDDTPPSEDEILQEPLTKGEFIAQLKVFETNLSTQITGQIAKQATHIASQVAGNVAETTTKRAITQLQEEAGMGEMFQGGAYGTGQMWEINKKGLVEAHVNRHVQNTHDRSKDQAHLTEMKEQSLAERRAYLHRENMLFGTQLFNWSDAQKSKYLTDNIGSLMGLDANISTNDEALDITATGKVLTELMKAARTKAA